MLTKAEAQAIKNALQYADNRGDFNLHPPGMDLFDMFDAVDRVTDDYAPNHGTDVIARGPNLSSTRMLDEAARALGWRTDFACGDSPITWDIVLEAIRDAANAAKRLKNG